MSSFAPSPAQLAHSREVLGVSPNATLGEIEKAYRSCAKQHHPDVGGDHAKMIAINNAMDWLRESAMAPPPPPPSRPAPPPRYVGAKGRMTPLSSTSGTNYAQRPEIRAAPPPPPPQRDERSIDEMIKSVLESLESQKKPSKKTMEDPAPPKTPDLMEDELVFESLFAAVTWDSPMSEADHKRKDPEFVAWLEAENAWNWHMCYSEKNGFKIMGSERKDGTIFLWKYESATGAMAMAAKRQ